MKKVLIVWLFIIFSLNIFSQNCSTITDILETGYYDPVNDTTYLPLVSADCNAISDPYIWNDLGCEIGLNRYLSRSTYMENLYLLNLNKQCNHEVNPPQSGAVNCDIPYDFCTSWYCPEKYYDAIKMLVDSKTQLVVRAMSFYFYEHQSFIGSDWYIAMENLICDINAAYDCANVSRPIVQAGIFEGFDREYKFPVPIDVFDMPMINELLSADSISYFKQDSISKKLILHVNGSGRVDITRPAAKLWFLYQAKQFIDAGYKSIHMGIYFDYAVDDEGYQQTYKLYNAIREYAIQQGSFVLLTGENSTDEDEFARLNGGDTLLFDYESRAIRPREISSPQVTGDYGCDNPIDIGVFADAPCSMSDIPAVIDPCVLEKLGGTSGGVSPTGCVYENVPFLAYLDFGSGVANVNNLPDTSECDITITPNIQGFAVDHNGVTTNGDTAWVGDVGKEWAASFTWGYDDSRWFSRLDPACQAEWISHYYCAIQDFVGGSGFLQIPGILMIKSPDNYCNSVDTLPNTDGRWLISDNPDVMDAVFNTLTPLEPQLNVVQICEFSDCGEECYPPSQIFGFKNLKSKYRYDISVENADCSSTYSIHIQGPNGDWFPHEIGTNLSFYPPYDGEYTINLRQDNLGIEDSDIGVNNVYIQYNMEKWCCNMTLCEEDHDPKGPKTNNGGGGKKVENEINLEDQFFSQAPSRSEENIALNSYKELIVFPNPQSQFANQISVKYNFDFRSEYSLQIFDINNKMLDQQNLINVRGNLCKIELPTNLISGVYNIVLINKSTNLKKHTRLIITE